MPKVPCRLQPGWWAKVPMTCGLQTYSIAACSQRWVLQAYKNDSYIKNIILTTPCIPIKNAARDTLDGDVGVPSGHTVLKEPTLHLRRANRLFFESKVTFILEHS